MIEDELTIENFAATMVWSLKHPGFQTLWLTSSDEHKEERRAELRLAFERWRAMELLRAQERER